MLVEEISQEVRRGCSEPSHPEQGLHVSDPRQTEQLLGHSGFLLRRFIGLPIQVLLIL